VRILDHSGVEAIDLGPQQRVAQVLLRERPERVALDHRVRLRAGLLCRERARHEEHGAERQGMKGGRETASSPRRCGGEARHRVLPAMVTEW
jgi:hypothetical protein